MLTRREFLAASGIVPLTRVSRMRAAQYDLVIHGGRVIDPVRRVERVAT